MNMLPSNAMPWNPERLVAVLRMLDLAVVAVSGIAAYALRHGHLHLPAGYLLIILLVLPATALTFNRSTIYSPMLLDKCWTSIRYLLPQWIMILLLVITGTYFSKLSAEFSRLWFVSWLVLSVGMFLGIRLWIRRLVLLWRGDGRLIRRVAVIGASDLGRMLIKRLMLENNEGIQVVGLYDDRIHRLSPEELQGYEVKGTTSDLVEYARDHHLDSVIIALPWNAERRLSMIVRQLRAVPVDVQLCLDRIGFRLQYSEVAQLGGMPLLMVLNRPLGKGKWVQKAILDQVTGFLALLFFLPLMLLIALLIRIDSPGPVLFKQLRRGLNGKPFFIYKFRSLHDRPAETSPAPSDGAETIVQVFQNDPRVTRVGKWLRKTSLDELPQLINVLKGEMSVIGPRPHAIQHDDFYGHSIREYNSRFRIKPGITGWAQIHGLRGNTENIDRMRMRIEYDLYYIDNWSIMLDIRILVLTVFRGFVHENAY